MDGEEERAVLYTVKVEAVRASCKIEGSDKGTFVGKEGAVNKINRLRIFCFGFEIIKWMRGVLHTFAVPIYLCDLQ